MFVFFINYCSQFNFNLNPFSSKDVSFINNLYKRNYPTKSTGENPSIACERLLFHGQFPCSNNRGTETAVWNITTTSGRATNILIDWLRPSGEGRRKKNRGDKTPTAIATIYWKFHCLCVICERGLGWENCIRHPEPSQGRSSGEPGLTITMTNQSVGNRDRER